MRQILGGTGQLAPDGGGEGHMEPREEFIERQPALRETVFGHFPELILVAEMGGLTDALAHAYEVPGFLAATGGDEVFLQLVAARIIEPVSKLIRSPERTG